MSLNHYKPQIKLFLLAAAALFLTNCIDIAVEVQFLDDNKVIVVSQVTADKNLISLISAQGAPGSGTPGLGIPGSNSIDSDFCQTATDSTATQREVNGSIECTSIQHMSLEQFIAGDYESDISKATVKQLRNKDYVVTYDINSIGKGAAAALLGDPTMAQLLEDETMLQFAKQILQQNYFHITIKAKNIAASNGLMSNGSAKYKISLIELVENANIKPFRTQLKP